MFTDAPFHNGPGGANPYSGFTAPNYAGVVAALTARRARVISVDSGDTVSRADGTQLARDTGAIDPSTGSPLLYTISATGTGLSAAVVDGIAAVSRIPLDVSAQAVDLVDMGETVDAVAAFVDHLEPNATGAPGLTCTGGFATSDYAGIDGDSFADTFLDVTPGAPVCFDIIPKQNDTVPATLVPQIFRAQINVIGDGFTPLDDRVVYFLVPPRIPNPDE